MLSIKSANLAAHNKSELDVSSIEELITLFTSKDGEAKHLEKHFEKCASVFENLKGYFDHFINKKEREDELYEQKLLLVEEKLNARPVNKYSISKGSNNIWFHIKREEEDVNNALRLRVHELEKVSSVVSRENSIREELFNSIRVLYERVYAYCKQLKNLYQTGEFAKVIDAPEEIDRDCTTEQETEKMVSWIQKILRYLEATFETIQAFNEAKNTFLEVNFH